MITVGSLFSGIGGIDLGLERAGMTVIWQAETDPYASKVLAKHWPDVPNLGDVTKVDWDGVERPDLVCGGYPCQPFSYAGKRGGTTDARHLWPHFADALRLLRPRWALLENVPGHLSLGFADVLCDLAALGFDAEWDLLSASAVGAPHLRYRLFVVAHASRDVQPEPTPGRPVRQRARPGSEPSDMADTNGRRRQIGSQQDGRADQPRQPTPRRSDVDRRRADVADTNGPARAPSWPSGQAIFRPGTLERLGRRGGGERDHWESEPDVGRVAHGIPSRVDRLRCLGNAVVPQVAEYVGRRIIEADCHCPCHQTVQPGLVPCPSCATNPDHSSR